MRALFGASLAAGSHGRPLVQCTMLARPPKAASAPAVSRIWCRSQKTTRPTLLRSGSLCPIRILPFLQAYSSDILYLAGTPEQLHRPFPVLPGDRARSSLSHISQAVRPAPCAHEFPERSSFADKRDELADEFLLWNLP